MIYEQANADIKQAIMGGWVCVCLYENVQNCIHTKQLQFNGYAMLRLQLGWCSNISLSL